MSSSKKRKFETSLNDATKVETTPTTPTTPSQEETYVYSVVKIITRKECVTTIKRTIVEEIRSLDDEVLHQATFCEEDPPETTVEEDISTPVTSILTRDASSLHCSVAKGRQVFYFIFLSSFSFRFGNVICNGQNYVLRFLQWSELCRTM